MNASIQLMSKRSAAKYKNISHYEDIVSEGVLAAYEELEGNPEATIARIYQVISTAQWKFLNVDCLSVTIPFEVVRLAKGLGSPEDKRGYSDEVIEWAKLICDSPQFDSKFHDKDGESDQAEAYEEQALVQAVWEAAAECLTEEEYDLFHAYFEQGVSQISLAEDLDISDRSVRYKFFSIREKVRKHAINKKWEL
jgi:RNA polymerase sigma factor (sigma-70 family)